MKGDVIVREALDSDRDDIIAIFNYYAAASYAAYPEIPVNERFFGFLREGTLAFFVLEQESRVVGFGLIKPLLPFPAFMGTGMLTYFILPEFTGKGLGSRLLERLTGRGRKDGNDLAGRKYGVKKYRKYPLSYASWVYRSGKAAQRRHEIR